MAMTKRLSDGDAVVDMVEAIEAEREMALTYARSRSGRQEHWRMAAILDAMADRMVRDMARGWRDGAYDPR